MDADLWDRMCATCCRFICAALAFFLLAACQQSGRTYQYPPHLLPPSYSTQGTQTLYGLEDGLRSYQQEPLLSVPSSLSLPQYVQHLVEGSLPTSQSEGWLEQALGFSSKKLVIIVLFLLSLLFYSLFFHSLVKPGATARKLRG